VDRRPARSGGSHIALEDVSGLLLIGALGEGCLCIASRTIRRVARTEVLALITQMLSAFRVNPEGVS
jgi:hypothetical protein